MSLTSCLKKAGDDLRKSDRDNVVKLAREYRASGKTPVAAAIQAVEDQIKAVQALIEEAQKPKVLTSPTRQDVIANQDRAGNAQALDAKAQIDREAAGQTLTKQTAPEQRKDTTTDIFGGPTVEDAERARDADRLAKAEAQAKKDKDSGQGGMFADEEAPSLPSNPDLLRAQADLSNALADLGDIFGKNTRLTMMPEQEAKILPVLVKLFDAAFRMGYHSFKDAAKFALDKIRAALGAEIANDLTLEHLQGAYISMSSGKTGIDNIRVVSGVEAKSEIEKHTAKADNQGQEKPNVPSPNVGVERDSDKPGAGPAMVPPVPNVAGGTAPRAGNTGGQASGSNGGGRQDGAGVSTGRSPAARERGDQLIRGGNESPGPASGDARTDFGERSGDSGITGIPPDAIPASEVKSVATDGTEDARKRSAQRTAGQLSVKSGDLQNVRDTLPYLLPAQQEDVHKAETIFAKPTGYGMLFTNGTGTGKAQPLDAKLMTPTGWKLMGEIKPGDDVVGVDGRPTRVLAVHPQGEKPIYRVTFSDGASTECCDEHLWETQTLYERRKSRANENWVCAQAKVRPLAEIRASIDKQHFVPIASPIDLPSTEQIIPAYTMGVFLGDGGLTTSPKLSNPEAEIIDRVRAELPVGWELRQYHVAQGKCDAYGLVDATMQRLANGAPARSFAMQAFDIAGLSGKMSHEKTIPDNYLHGSIVQRVALLQGLMDTDGWVDIKSRSAYYSTSSPALAAAVSFIARSLGGTANTATKIPTFTYKGEKKTGRLSYSVLLNLPKEFTPFSLPRKAAVYRANTKYPPRRKIVGVELVGNKLAQCISVDHPRHLYVTDDCIVTHNTYTGLGVVKRFAMQGKENTLIVVPDNKIASDWIKSGRALGLDITQLDDTTQAGKGIVLTTYANLGANDALAKRQWDLIIPDESHSLMQAADGEATGYLHNLRAITHHPDGTSQRFTMLNRADIDRMTALNKQIVANNKIINGDDTMDVMRQSLQAENAKLEKQLAPLNTKLNAARDAVKAEVADMQGEKRTRMVFLSATPFAYEKTVDWANGYLFDYMADYPYNPMDAGLKYNQPDPRQHFMMTRFGYTMRVNKLNAPGPKVDSGLLQRQFNAELKKKGVLSGRMLDVKPDYDRRFVLVDSAIGNKIDEALEWLTDKASDESEAQAKIEDRSKRESGMAALRDAIKDQFDYLSRRYLLEAIKAEAVIPIVKQHLALGRKVVVFHDYNKGGSTNPFAIQKRTGSTDNTNEGRAKVDSFNKALAQFNTKFPELVTGLNDLLSPIEVFKKQLPQTMLINGKEKEKDLLARYLSFQDDANGPQVMLVQSDKNKGWSGHDTTGRHQRVLINLGQPTAPTKAIQQEGRIYRTGQASNAIMRYLNTGTSWERWAFATTIAQRSSTAENLGMGEQARALKDSFIAAFEESDTYAPGHEGEGIGGKARDKASNDAITEYDRAKSFYWGTQKKNSKTKAAEGTDYFATPEPVGLKMVEWLDARSGEDLMEPSGGHGAIARWMPEKTQKTVIEPSANLRSRMALVLDMPSTKLIDGTFEELNVVNKFDGIAMNPPFGSGGKTAIDHLAKAATHLRDGGRIVALIPTGPAADKKFDKWFYESSERPTKPLFKTDAGEVRNGDTVTVFDEWSKKDRQFVVGSYNPTNQIFFDVGRTIGFNVREIKKIEKTGKQSESYNPTANLMLVADIKLPQVTFERAGTAVATRIVVIEKHAKESDMPQRTAARMDFSNIDDINDLFDRLENVTLPKRPKVDPVELEVAPKGEKVGQTAQADKPAKPAKAEKKKTSVGDMVTLGGKQYPAEIYTTNAGKDKIGVWMDSKDEAQKFSQRTFTHSSKKGKWFVDEFWFPKDAKDDFDAPMASRTKVNESGVLDRNGKFKNWPSKLNWNRAEYNDVVSLLPANYRNDPHRREPLSAKDWDLLTAAALPDLQKINEGLKQGKGFGIDELGNIEADARNVDLSQIKGAIEVAEKHGLGIYVKGVMSRHAKELQNVGFVSEFGLGGVLMREAKTTQNPIPDPNSVFGRKDIGSVMSYRPRGFSRLMFSRGTDPFYSALTKGIENVKANAAPGLGWLDAIKGLVNKGAVKADEVEWSGVTDWLKLQTGKVMKADVVAFLDANGVKVEETVLGGEIKEDPEGIALRKAVFDKYESEIQRIYKDMDKPNLNGDQLGSYHDQLIALQNKRNAEADAAFTIPENDPSKYSQYQLPGGTNYREVLLTLPINKKEQSKDWESMVDAGFSVSEMAAKSNAKFPDYRSSHWDQTNVLAHIRVNDRTDSDGKRVLFVEEIQSDWGQAGKKQGFSAPKYQVLNESGNPVLMFKGNGRDRAIYETKAEAQQRITDGGSSAYGWTIQEFRDQAQPPSAPFVGKTDAWVSLAMKRVIKMAVDEGYDKVAFVNGEQSAERYDLSKQIGAINYEPTDDGKYEIEAYDLNDKRVLSEDEITIERVEELVGKEIAKKIAAGDGKVKDAGGYRNWHRLSGLDLKVGGEGMKAFYNQIVPSVAKDVLRKLGGGQLEKVSMLQKIEDYSRSARWIGPDRTIEDVRNMLEIADRSGRDVYDNPLTGSREFFPINRVTNSQDIKNIQRSMRNGKTFAEAMLSPDLSSGVAELFGGKIERFDAGNDTLQQTGFTITPAMKERAADGLPLFAKQSTGGMTVDQARAITDPLTAKWNLDVKVVATPADLPVPAPSDVRGMYMGGKIWIVASNNANRAQILETLGHEAIAHHGLREMLGREDWRKLMTNINLAIKSGNKPLNAISQRVRSEYVDDNGKFNLSAIQEADEIAAKVVEGAIDPVTGEFNPGFGFLKSVFAKVAQFLRDLGIDVKFTNLELQGMLVASMRNMESGSRMQGGGAQVVAANRGAVDAERNALKALSENDDLFIFPKSDKDTVDGITADINPAIIVQKITSIPGETRYVFTTPNGDTQRMMVRPFNPYANEDAPTMYGFDLDKNHEMTGIVTERPGKNPEVAEGKDDVYIDVSLMQPGEFGSAIYAIAANYAHNTGKIFIGDPAGLSDKAMKRRIDNMLSSALKFGTTDHLAPHPRQVKGDKSIGVPALDWTYGDDLANIKSLVRVSQAIYEPQNPITFEPVSGRFVDSEGGELDGNALRSVIKLGRPGKTGVGITTAKRNAVLSALVREEGGATGSAGRAGTGVLERLLAIGLQHPVSTREIFYNRSGDLLTSYTPEEAKKKQLEEEAARKAEAEKPKAPTGRKVTADQVDMFNPQESLFARGPVNIWSAPAPGDSLIYEIQDQRVDLKRIQQAIEKSGQQIEEKWDARLAETIYPGRVAHRSQVFLDTEAKPMLEAMAKAKISMDEMADYLHARGAEERNVQIAKVNANMPDGGAGTNTQGTLMTTANANAYLAGINPARKAQLDVVAARVDAITKGTRRLLVAEGLEKQSAINNWESVYKNYVPMFKDEAESAMPPHPQGTGFTVKGKASKRAMGSTKEVTNMLAHVLMQREAAITRAEKNRVALSLYGMALSHPNPDFWTTIKPGMSNGQVVQELQSMGVDVATAFVGMKAVPTIRVVDPVTNQVVDRANPVYKSLPGAITFKLNGEDRVIMLNVKHERGARLATSLKNLDGLTTLDIAGSIVGKSTRWLAAVNTQYNPAFGLVNLTRDVLGGVINLGSTELKGNALKVLAKTPIAILGIARELSSKGQTGKWQTLYRQFKADGAQTGWRENFRDPNERAKAIEKELADLKRAGKLSPGRFAHAMLDLLDGFNTTLENAVRLSAYSQALDRGISRPNAARLARELTVDFNRKGRMGREVGPLYAFFNASVQGSARTIDALKGPTGGRIIAGGLGLGVIQALMLLAAGYDDDELKEFEKTRALIIPTNWTGEGKKTHIMIPYPLGLHVLPNTGRVLAELSLNGGKDIGKRSMEAIGEIAGAFNPLGGGNIFTADGALKTIAPTLIDPVIEIGFNRNFAGNPIEREGYGSESDNRPGFVRTKEATQRSTTGQVYMGISKVVNTLTGGSDYEAGTLSPTPERIRYIGQTAGGGVLREIEKTINATTATARGEKTTRSQIPVLGRFAGEVDDDQVQKSRYFDTSRKLHKLDSSLKAMTKAGDGDAAQALIEKNPEVLMTKQFNKAQQIIGKLNKEAVQTIGNVGDVEAIDEARVSLMRSLNESMKEMEKSSGRVTLADHLKPMLRPRMAEAVP